MLRWRNLAAALDLGSSVEKREGAHQSLVHKNKRLWKKFGFI